MSAQKIAAVMLDVGSFGLGAFILVHEEWTGRSSEFLVLAAVALCAGLPAVRSLFALRAGKNVTVSITDSSSGSPAPSSQPSSLPPSSSP